MARIPKKFKVGGATIDVRMVDRCNNNSIGVSALCGGYIEIANSFNKDNTQSEDSKVNTFYHELIHCILDTMGKNELSQDEVFVNCFAGFLTEAMANASFVED